MRRVSFNREAIVLLVREASGWVDREDLYFRYRRRYDKTYSSSVSTRLQFQSTLRSLAATGMLLAKPFRTTIVYNVP